ncbi:hypothetical protein HH310_42350 [Actinoplanes sp. TBRC 11911]|uniref:hypothetical protein n=1 Tax=Actinoplanes sp. TBRC 11911 TaxID=2729386 RepID=UPI00145EC97C|nr:hypothetical protein [Actinoplanes sp. TBRC 11911]NMO57792.1 hypothetical protein [Actinoplanes sp. TBRC 11911]
MKTRKLIICRRDTPHATTTVGKDVYGLIDWDGVPVLIVGGRLDAVKREAIRVFAGVLATVGTLTDDTPDFAEVHPLPDPDGPMAIIDDWMELLRRATAIPSFEILDDEVVIAR